MQKDHTVIDGERDLVIAYDKTTNQFALANPKSFVFDKSHVDGMSDDAYTDLMKNGSVIFKDFKHSNGRTNDALLYLNPFKMKIYVKNEIPEFEVNPKVVTSVDMKMDGRNLNADPFMKPPVDNEQKQSRGLKRSF